jgi:hypothetical protein
MIDKKLIIAIVVIVVVIIGGFFAMKYIKGSEGAATGQLTEIPGANAGNTAGGTVVKVDASKFSEITESMSASDVVKLVGEPNEKQTTTTAKGHPITYWYYTDSNNKVWQIGISNNEVQVVRKY